jgi:reductive dehalogenase
MDNDMIRHAPDLPVTTETAFAYFEVGKVAMMLARYINMLGYNARAHVDGNYRVLCVPVAADAGLGELGRLGLLITPGYGPRIRLSVVTTNLELLQDEPVAFGVQEFCGFCMKCAFNCPSGSIEKGNKREIKGVEKWQSQQESCYAYWRKQGTDCSLCIRVCPYAHPRNLMHDVVRWGIRRNGLARRLALAGDDLLYGRRPRGRFPLPDWHK